MEQSSYWTMRLIWYEWMHLRKKTWIEMVDVVWKMMLIVIESIARNANMQSNLSRNVKRTNVKFNWNYFFVYLKRWLSKFTHKKAHKIHERTHTHESNEIIAINELFHLSVVSHEIRKNIFITNSADNCFGWNFRSNFALISLLFPYVWSLHNASPTDAMRKSRNQMLNMHQTHQSFF